MSNTKILVNHGERKAIAKLLNCTYPTVRSALNGNINTALAYKIRKIAMERGGIEIEAINNKKTKP